MVIDWEISGDLQALILLAPMNLAKWASGEAITRDEQRRILQELRSFLSAKGIKSDIAQSDVSQISLAKCMWAGCDNRTLTGSAYCRSHLDETLLR